jgi:hypothetical protein
MLTSPTAGSPSIGGHAPTVCLEHLGGLTVIVESLHAQPTVEAARWLLDEFSHETWFRVVSASWHYHRMIC